MFSRKATVPTICVAPFLNYKIFWCMWYFRFSPVLNSANEGSGPLLPSHSTMRTIISKKQSVLFLHLFSLLSWWNFFSWTFWVNRKSLQILSLRYQCSNFTHWRQWTAQKPCQALAQLPPRLPPEAHVRELLWKQCCPLSWGYSWARCFFLMNPIQSILDAAVKFSELTFFS